MDSQRLKDEETQMPKFIKIKSRYKLETNNKDLNIKNFFSKTKLMSNDAVIKSKY